MGFENYLLGFLLFFCVHKTARERERARQDIKVGNHKKREKRTKQLNPGRRHGHTYTKNTRSHTNESIVAHQGRRGKKTTIPKVKRQKDKTKNEGKERS